MNQAPYVPPFTLSAKSVSMVAEISALIERYADCVETLDLAHLQKINRIKIIHATLSMAGNTLTESQVAEIFEDYMKSTGSQFGTVSGTVNGTVNDVLGYMREHPGCRANEIEMALSVPIRTIRRHISVLKGGGKIEFRGAPKTGGYYCLADSG